MSVIQLTPEELSNIIQNAVSSVVNSQPTTSSQQNLPAPHIKKPERPIVDLDYNESQWFFFLEEWELYKRKTQLTPTQLLDELRSACSKELRRALFEFSGGENLQNLNEEEMISKIKQCCVKGKNQAVHKNEFYKMVQSPGQTTYSYVSKLKAKAAHCNFTISCPNVECGKKINYSEQMVCDQMVVGIYDKEILGEVLAKDSQLKSFQDRFDLIQSLESGKLAKNQLSEESTISVQKTAYKKSKEQNNNQNTNAESSKACRGCNSLSHSGRDRPKKCPNWGKTCTVCNKPNHTSDVCFRKPNQNSSNNTNQNSSNQNSSNNTNQNSSISASLISEDISYFLKLSSVNDKNNTLIPHLEWHNGNFIPCKPGELPFVSIKISVMTEQHKNLNNPLDKGKLNNDVNITACPDTGAQTCACGTEILSMLNISKESLIKSSHSIMGVTKSKLSILGVLCLKLEKNNFISNQVVYVSENVQGFYLSIKAQKELKILPNDFPNEETSNVLKIETNHIAKCGCPVRTKLPPKPIIPFPAIPENRLKIQEWIIQYYTSSAFNTCPHQLLPLMSGKPLDIHFRKDAQPRAYHTPIPIPYHWKKAIKQDLEKDTKLGIIERVPEGTPTIWCSRMVVVKKKDGEPRRTIDYQALNNSTMRETHHTITPFQQVMTVPPHTKKTVVDAWNGYHSLPLSPEAKDCTTFITEWGRYRYKCAPQGFHASGDAYTRKFDDITTDVERKIKCIDDTLLWDTNIDASFTHTIDYIHLCHTNGIIFNPKKFKFANDEIEFSGFIITSDGIKPTDQMLSSILQFPTPKCISDARSFFGLVNQVAYAHANTEKMKPFRELLKSNRKWYWDDNLEALFHECKHIIIEQVKHGVKNFEINRPTCICTDWSKNGTGFVLLQKHCECQMENSPLCCKDGWKLVFAGSHTSNEAEQGYAPIEGEALAVVEALNRCRMFVSGCPNLLVVVDHQPLVKVFNDQCLEKITNPRLFRLKEKTLQFKFQIKYIPGKFNSAPDAFSRYPVQEEVSSIEVIANETYYESISSMLCKFYETLNDSFHSVTWDIIESESVKDDESKQLMEYIRKGFPAKKSDMPTNLQPYWNLKEELSHVNDVPIYGSRIIVPAKLRSEILDSLHSAHQGVTNMKSRAQQCLYWPHINRDITNKRAQCKWCNEIAPSQANEPLLLSEMPEYPFQQVVADYFHVSGHKYLIYADRYTGWISLAHIKADDGNSKFLKQCLRNLFSIYGVPEHFSSDGGPPFASYEMQLFFKNWGIKSRISSAYYAQSNGRAELSVKVAKRILLNNIGDNGTIDNDLVVRALLQYKNTPLQSVGLSPAQMLFGRSLRDCIPSLELAKNIRPEWKSIAENRENSLAKRNVRIAEDYNAHVKSLENLNIGDFVSIQNQMGIKPKRWDKTGSIVEYLGNRQYLVKVDGSGRITLRNRKFLRKIEPVCLNSPLPFSTTKNLDNDNAVDPAHSINDSLNNNSNDIATRPPNHIFSPVSNNVMPPAEITHPVDSDIDLSLDHSNSEDPNMIHENLNLTPTIRRSERVCQPRRDLSPTMEGKYHSYT